MRTSQRPTFAALLSCLGVMMGIVPAQGQFPPQPLGVVSCSASPVVPLVRRSNIAALQGSIPIACANTPGVATEFVTTIPTDVTALFTNANATNNIDFSEGPTITDAVLVINSNHSMTPVTTSSTPPPPLPQYGQLTAPNQIQWFGVELPVPGAPLNAASPPRCVRVTEPCAIRQPRPFR